MSPQLDMRFGADMELYVEYVIINNFLIDYLVLYLTSLAVKRRVLWWRMLLSALFGACYAVLAPLIPYPYDIPLKAVSLLIMCAIAAGIKKPLIKYTLIFLIITCFMGGLVTAGRYMGMRLINALSEPNSCLAGIVSGVALLVTAFSKAMARMVNYNKRHGELLAVQIDTGKAEYLDKALYDSGNRLYYKGLYPVIVIDSEYVSCSSVGKIKVKTVTGSDTMELYNIKKLSVNNTVYNNVYAVKRELNSGYKVILHSDIKPEDKRKNHSQENLLNSNN